MSKVIEYFLCYRLTKTFSATSAIVSVFIEVILFKVKVYLTSGVEHISRVLDDRLGSLGKILVEVLCHKPSAMYVL